MDKERVLITGGAGYIGSHTAVELIAEGFDVVLVDNLANSSPKVVDGIQKITGAEVPFENVNCCDITKLKKVFEKYEFRSVIHFAAHKAVGESVTDPLKYYANNIESFVSVLSLMKEFGRKNVIFSSSATVYGEPEKLPVTEMSPRMPATSPYGNTKQICEDILSDTVRATALKGISLRYFNPIGAHPSALIGESPRGVPGNLVPFITQTAAGVREKLSIFGNDYPTPDGTALRDYIDIMDLARAHVAAVKRLVKKRGKEGYEIYNIGTGRPVSVLDLVTKFEQATGVKLNYTFAERRPGDVAAVWADAAKADTELGWRAETPLEETLRNAWRWQQKAPRALR